MSGFTKTKKFAVDFQGDHVTMTLRRLTRDQIKTVSQYIEHTPEGNIKVSFTMSLQMIEDGESFIKECVTNFNGLQDADGNNLTWEDVLDETYFLDLVGMVYGELLRISMVPEDLAKKSDKPQEEDSPLDTEQETSSSAA